MAEEPLVVRGINWRETFPFTHIFRSFRIAIHPSKLVLALLAMLCLYFGGRILDGLWVDQYRAVPNEIFMYESARTTAQFQQERQETREGFESDYARGLLKVKADKKDGMPDVKDTNDIDGAKKAAAQRKYTADVKYWITKVALPRALKEIDDEYKATSKRLADAKPANDAEKQANLKAIADNEKAHDQNVHEAYAQAVEKLKLVQNVEGEGLFQAFLHYQSTQVAKVVQGVLANNWLGGMYAARPGEPGVIISTYKFFTVAPSWALRHHSLYFVLYGLLFLCVWSLFGGAIARIAAVHVADEGRKLSMRQGLSFAFSKFLSFISAPMIPLIIVVVIGVVVAVVGGILMLIPQAGPVIVGALFFLPLAAGFVMTLVLLGTAGGFNLMYPTIAVEGSDSFDAISRSFSYVYAKPWRMLFYSLIAIGYGSLTFLFVRLFVWLMLCLTQYFVGMFVFKHALNTDYLWPTMYPAPGFWTFSYDPNTHVLGWGEKIGTWLIAIWVYLLVSMLAAFAISFYFSSSTIIYYLMRREVDATEMDDVYLEQPEEDFAESPVAAPVTPSAEVSAATVSQEAPTGGSVTPSTGTPATADAPPASPSGDSNSPGGQ